jgi:hypothetical protein
LTLAELACISHDEVEYETVKVDGWEALYPEQAGYAGCA